MGRDERHGPPSRRLLHSLAAVLCPPEAAAEDLLDAVVDHVELSLGAMPAAVRGALRAGLATYELGAVVRWGRPASRLDPPRAARYLDAWRHGGPVRRELVKAVRGLVCMAYYELPEVKERLGYRPEQWIERVKQRRLATRGEDIARHAASVCAPDPLPRLECRPVCPTEGEPVGALAPGAPRGGSSRGETPP